MSRDITVSYIYEGTSDEALIDVLQILVARAAGDDAAIRAETIPTPPVPVQKKFRTASEQDTHCDILFVHRDADSRGPGPRYEEIREAAEVAGYTKPYVCVVPVQAIEAWLLADEQGIRDVSGKRSGRADLGLPRRRAIENDADPKKRLQDAIRAASETTGRRRNSLNKAFSRNRQVLLQRLDPDGPVKDLPSFRQLVSDIENAVARIS